MDFSRNFDDTDRLLVFGGAYGNLEATTALFDTAAKLGIADGHMISTGDTVAYCADPAGVAQVLMGRGINGIRGNCEESLGNGGEACGCGFEAGSVCDIASKNWFAYCDAHIDDETRAWFRGLPRHLGFTFGGKKFLVVHGSHDDVSEFVFASTENLGDKIKAAGADCVIAGHSGLFFTHVAAANNLCWHNAGVIGMPANDGTPRVWYSVITATGDGGIVFEHKALDYEAGAAAEKMMKADLPEGYANALTSGLWPSLDILPRKEAALTGNALRETRIEWKTG